MQSTANGHVGGSIHGIQIAGRAGRCANYVLPGCGSNPFAQTFDHPHPPIKCGIQFQGIEASESKKFIEGSLYWAK